MREEYEAYQGYWRKTVEWWHWTKSYFFLSEAFLTTTLCFSSRACLQLIETPTFMIVSAWVLSTLVLSTRKLTGPLENPAGYLQALRAAGLTIWSTREDIALLDEESLEALLISLLQVLIAQEVAGTGSSYTLEVIRGRLIGWQLCWKGFCFSYSPNCPTRYFHLINIPWRNWPHSSLAVKRPDALLY